MTEEMIQPKTIHISRVRKLNSVLIDKRFEYGSEQFEFGLLADVPEGHDTQKAIEELRATVDAEIEAQISETVSRLRKVARSRIFFDMAIRDAFFYLMATQNLSDTEIEIAWEKFAERLEIEQAAQSY